MMELSHLTTKSIMVAVVTFLTLCLALGIQGQSTAVTTGSTAGPTELPTTASPSSFAPNGTTNAPNGTTIAPNGTTNAPNGTTDASTVITSTPNVTTSETSSSTPNPQGTTGKTEPSGTSTESPTKAPNKGGFKWATFFSIIILIGCLIGIGFCAYQFYRKRQTDSYHTL